MGIFGSIGGALAPSFDPTSWRDLMPGGDNDVRDFIPGIGDARAAAEQNSANRKFAREQMAFQERMSSSAYQRAMDDMKKAGLNPMLAFSQGGASTPAGAMPTINSETKTKLGETVLNTALKQQAFGQTQQTVDNQIAATESQKMLNSASAAKTVAETEKIRAELPGAQTRGKMWSKASEVLDQLNKVIRNSAKEVQKGNRESPAMTKWKKENYKNFEWDFKNNRVIPKRK